MKHRIAALAFSLVAIAGLLHTSVLPASACACVPLTQDNNLQTLIAHNDHVVVEGQPAPSDSGDPSWSRRFDVDTVYLGDAPPQIVLTQRQPSVTDAPTDTTGWLDTTAPDCTYVILGPTGTHYLLFLNADGSGAYEPLGCDSHATAEEADYPYLRDLSAALQTAAPARAPNTSLPTPTIAPELASRTEKDAVPVVIHASGAAPAPAATNNSGDKDVPVAILLPLAFIIPLGVLLGFSFLTKRRGGGH